MNTARVGRPSLCGKCGTCARCKQAARSLRWWNKLTPDERRAKIAQRDAARVREHDRRKQARRRTAGTEEQLLKIAARDEVRKARRRGDLVPGPCELEGRGPCRGAMHAHHDDYTKPLEVRWLCRRHHDDLHHDSGDPF